LHDQGVTIVMVTHEVDIAACAGRVMYLQDGQIVSDRMDANSIAAKYGHTDGRIG
jgi:ABC-type lipoprotein export system ATPase subunit